MRVRVRVAGVRGAPGEVGLGGGCVVAVARGGGAGGLGVRVGEAVFEVFGWGWGALGGGVGVEGELRGCGVHCAVAFGTRWRMGMGGEFVFGERGGGAV